MSCAWSSQVVCEFSELQRVVQLFGNSVRVMTASSVRGSLSAFGALSCFVVDPSFKGPQLCQAEQQSGHRALIYTL